MANYKRKHGLVYQSMTDAIAVLRAEYTSRNTPLPYLFNHTADLAIHGDSRYLAGVEELMERIEANTYSIQAKTQISDVWGQRLAMGEWLAGSPTCFRRHKKASQLSSVPFSIYLCIGMGMRVTPELQKQRGLAVAALAMKLSAIRPVDMYIIDENIYPAVMWKDGSWRPEEIACTAIKLDTAPCNLAQLAYCASSSAVTTDIIYKLANLIGHHTINWPRMRYDFDKSKEYATTVLGLLGETTPESAIYLSGTINEEVQAFSDPVQWVNEQMIKYGGLAED